MQPTDPGRQSWSAGGGGGAPWFPLRVTRTLAGEYRNRILEGLWAIDVSPSSLGSIFRGRGNEGCNNETDDNSLPC